MISEASWTLGIALIRKCYLALSRHVATPTPANVIPTALTLYASLIGAAAIGTFISTHLNRRRLRARRTLSSNPLAVDNVPNGVASQDVPMIETMGASDPLRSAAGPSTRTTSAPSRSRSAPSMSSYSNISYDDTDLSAVQPHRRLRKRRSAEPNTDQPSTSKRRKSKIDKNTRTETDTRRSKHKRSKRSD